MSTINVNRMVDSQGGVLAPISSVHKNRIINGQMTIDQRNAGASVTPTANIWDYSLDRWSTFSTQASKLTVQQVSDSPTGFKNSLRVTSSSAYSIVASDIFSLRQVIEGFNFADFMYGTASANTFTLSFWVKSSLTGTFGGGLQNNGGTRGYAFSYTINAANTWEYKTVTISGDTTGTWLTTNGFGIAVIFGLGVGSTYSFTAGSWGNNSFANSATGATSVVGTSGATFQVTGVQLEKGTQATSFEYRQYGQELALCQRYYQTSYPYGTAVDAATGPTEGASFICINTSDSSNGGMLPVTMRATPTFAMYSTVGGAGSPSARNNASGASVTGITLVGSITTSLPRLSKTGGLSAVGTPYSAHYTASAEL